MELPFIGLDELLANKRAVGRLHDLDDAAKLAASAVKSKKGKRNQPKPLKFKK